MTQVKEQHKRETAFDIMPSQEILIADKTMVPVFNPGDTVVTDPDAPVQSGQYAIVHIEGESAAVHRITWHGEDQVQLECMNPGYPDRIISLDRIQRLNKIVAHKFK